MKVYRVYSRMVDNTPVRFNNKGYTAIIREEFDTAEEAVEFARAKNDTLKEGTWGDYIVIVFDSDDKYNLDILYSRGIYDKQDIESGWKFDENWILE